MDSLLPPPLTRPGRASESSRASTGFTWARSTTGWIETPPARCATSTSMRRSRGKGEGGRRGVRIWARGCCSSVPSALGLVLHHLGYIRWTYVCQPGLRTRRGKSHTSAFFFYARPVFALRSFVDQPDTSPTLVEQRHARRFRDIFFNRFFCHILTACFAGEETRRLPEHRRALRVLPLEMKTTPTFYCPRGKRPRGSVHGSEMHAAHDPAMTSRSFFRCPAFSFHDPMDIYLFSRGGCSCLVVRSVLIFIKS